MGYCLKMRMSENHTTEIRRSQVPGVIIWELWFFMIQLFRVSCCMTSLHNSRFPFSLLQKNMLFIVSRHGLHTLANLFKSWNASSEKIATSYIWACGSLLVENGWNRSSGLPFLAGCLLGLQEKTQKDIKKANQMVINAFFWNS